MWGGASGWRADCRVAWLRVPHGCQWDVRLLAIEQTQHGTWPLMAQHTGLAHGGMEQLQDRHWRLPAQQVRPHPAWPPMCSCRPLTPQAACSAARGRHGMYDAHTQISPAQAQLLPPAPRLAQPSSMHQTAASGSCPSPPPDAEQVLLVHSNGLHHAGQKLVGCVAAHPREGCAGVTGPRA
jgi:hypothetical protein